MPFELSWEAGGVHRRYFDRVTAAERERSFDLICGDSRFDELTFSITDYLDVVEYEISDASTEEIAARHIAPLRTNPNIVIAAVVVDPQIIEAIQYFISLQFTAQEYRIFRTLAEARAWIADKKPAPHLSLPQRML